MQMNWFFSESVVSFGKRMVDLVITFREVDCFIFKLIDLLHIMNCFVSFSLILCDITVCFI